MPNVQQILNDIRVRLPSSTNTFTDGVVIGWMNTCQNEIWKYCASTDLYEFDTVASQSIYSYASDMKPDKIKSVMKSDSTTVDGTEGYVTLSRCGYNDELSGDMWYDAEGGIGIYPNPTSDDAGYNIKITYEPSPVQLSTDTLLTVPSISTDYHDILKWRVMRDIAGSGRNPDIELANNYAANYNALLATIKMDYAKRQAKQPARKWNYKESWYNG